MKLCPNIHNIPTYAHYCLKDTKDAMNMVLKNTRYCIELYIELHVFDCVYTPF